VTEFVFLKAGLMESLPTMSRLLPLDIQASTIVKKTQELDGPLKKNPRSAKWARYLKPRHRIKLR
jgi:hypothetical protein